MSLLEVGNGTVEVLSTGGCGRRRRQSPPRLRNVRHTKESDIYTDLCTVRGALISFPDGFQDVILCCMCVVHFTPGGDPHLGGDDWDAAIVDWIVARLDAARVSKTTTGRSGGGQSSSADAGRGLDVNDPVIRCEWGGSPPVLEVMHRASGCHSTSDNPTPSHV